VDKVKPSRPRRAKKTTNKVQPPLSAEDRKLFSEKEKPNKYAPKMKVGKPTIKAPGSKVVTTVGLGKLTVETINGRSTDTNV
tara:strand:- start:755 stop:1000 length:246 start_codon:yes stop_codon:yes gene_type:complete